MEKTTNHDTQGAVAMPQTPGFPGSSQTLSRNLLQNTHEQRKDSIPILTIGNLALLGRIFGPIRQRLLAFDANANRPRENSGHGENGTTESGNVASENSGPDTTGG
jgi:hypothetical protein